MVPEKFGDKAKYATHEEEHKGWNNEKLFQVDVVEPEIEADSNNDPCEPIKSKGECDGNSLCTWCTNLAVPSECWLITDAKSLPPGVYDCDKLSEEETVTKPEEAGIIEHEPIVERGNHHHDHSDAKNHEDKKEKDDCKGPPMYVWIYPIALIVSMISNRCFLCCFATTLKKLETPVATVHA